MPRIRPCLPGSQPLPLSSYFLLLSTQPSPEYPILILTPFPPSPSIPSCPLSADSLQENNVIQYFTLSGEWLTGLIPLVRHHQICNSIQEWPLKLPYISPSPREQRTGHWTEKEQGIRYKLPVITCHGDVLYSIGNKVNNNNKQ